MGIFRQVTRKRVKDRQPLEHCIRIAGPLEPIGWQKETLLNLIFYFEAWIHVYETPFLLLFFPIAHLSFSSLCACPETSHTIKEYVNEKVFRRALLI